MGARNVGDRERAYGKSLKAFQGELHSGCRNSKTARLEKVRGKLKGGERSGSENEVNGARGATTDPRRVISGRQ